MYTIDELTLEQLKQGYIKETDHFRCIFCEQTYINGHIYKCNSDLVDAHTAMIHHLQDEHGGALSELLQLDKKTTMMSDVQKRMISYFADKKTDKEIADITHTALSTVRQQRYQLKEKAKQAKVFLAMYELSETLNEFKAYIDIHQSATMVDDRYLISIKEEQMMLDKYFISIDPLKLKIMPSKQKHKIVVLKRITEEFKMDVQYTEKEVNEVIKEVFDDFVTIRRYLIEYGFLKRTDDGTMYWKP